MMPKTNIKFQPCWLHVDGIQGMGIAASGHVDSTQRPSVDTDMPLSFGQLAHELNSLLDGSLRCLSLVQQNLCARSSESPMPGIGERLATARHGLVQMSNLLNRVQRATWADHTIFSERLTMREALEHIQRLMRPLAEEHQIDLIFDLSPTAGMIPCATLMPVILNGVRNALESCAKVDQNCRQVELSIAINSHELLMLIVDSGVGVSKHSPGKGAPKLPGHGYGLKLSQRIVRDLGGELRLTNIPFGSGAVLHMSVPLARLKEHAGRV